MYFTRENFGDQADDECLKILNKNQTVQMSQHVSELRNVAYKRKLYTLFLDREKNICEKQYFIEYRFRHGMKEVLSSQIY